MAKIRTKVSNLPLLDEAVRFDRIIHKLAINKPVPERLPNSSLPASNQAFRLRDSASPYVSKAESPWVLKGVVGNDWAILLYMTKDRLKYVRLSPDLHEALYILDKANELEASDGELFKKLARVLMPLFKYNVFEQCVAVSSGLAVLCIGG